MAILPPFLHIVETVVNNTTSIVLNVTNSNNVGDRAYFVFSCPVTIRDNIIGSPIPVFININGVDTVPLKNRFGVQITSDKVPTRAFGNYMIDTSGETPEPYVILLNSPKCVQDA